MTDYFKASECMIRLVQRCRCMLTIANGPPVGLTKLTSEVPVTNGSDSGRSQLCSVSWFSWKVLVGKRSAKDVAVGRYGSCMEGTRFCSGRKSDWKRLASGLRLLLSADRAFKTSTPDFEGYF